MINKGVVVKIKGTEFSGVVEGRKSGFIRIFVRMVTEDEEGLGVKHIQCSFLEDDLEPIKY